MSETTYKGEDKLRLSRTYTGQTYYTNKLNPEKKQATGTLYPRGLFVIKALLSDCHHENILSTDFCESITNAIAMVDIA